MKFAQSAILSLQADRSSLIQVVVSISLESVTALANNLNFMKGRHMVSSFLFVRIVMDIYKTIKTEAHDEFVERRSRFIGYIKPVIDEESAIDFINEKKRIHWDATHNVYAYILREGQIKRYSDDGEPQGTAGIPVLDVLQKADIVDVVVVVTRYFGGILLGAGGLVRAYSHGASIAVAAGGIITMEKSLKLALTCDYNQYGKLSGLIPTFGGVIENSEFTDSVELSFYLPKDKYDPFVKLLADVTCGSVDAEITGEEWTEQK